jgi:hypothetical protein
MKKLVFIAVILLLVITLAGCSSNEPEVGLRPSISSPNFDYRENNDEKESKPADSGPEDTETPATSDIPTSSLIDFSDYWSNNSAFDLQQLVSDLNSILHSERLQNGTVVYWFHFTNNGAPCAFMLRGSHLAYIYDVIGEGNTPLGYDIVGKSVITNIFVTTTDNPTAILTLNLKQDEAKALVEILENALVKGMRDPFVGVKNTNPLYFGDPF